MGIFSSIKEKIFGKDDDEKADKPVATSKPTPTTPAKPAPISEVDVEARLDAMAGAGNLNWRASIVDLMKLVGLDASYAERKELAHELGDTDYSGTAEENIWLHKQVMTKLAENGGRVPASLRD